jgi:hypothetical protein
MKTFRKFCTEDSKNTGFQSAQFILPGNLEPGISALLGYIVCPVLYFQLLRESVLELLSYK